MIARLREGRLPRHAMGLEITERLLLEEDVDVVLLQELFTLQFSPLLPFFSWWADVATRFAAGGLVYTLDPRAGAKPWLQSCRMQAHAPAMCTPM